MNLANASILSSVSDSHERLLHQRDLYAYYLWINRQCSIHLDWQLVQGHSCNGTKSPYAWQVEQPHQYQHGSSHFNFHLNAFNHKPHKAQLFFHTGGPFSQCYLTILSVNALGLVVLQLLQGTNNCGNFTFSDAYVLIRVWDGGKYQDRTSLLFVIDILARSKNVMQWTIWICSDIKSVSLLNKTTQVLSGCLMTKKKNVIDSFYSQAQTKPSNSF